MNRQVTLLLPAMFLLPFNTAADIRDADSPLTDAFDVAPAESESAVPVVAGDANGSFVFVWDGIDESMSGVKAALYDHKGFQRSSVIAVSTMSDQVEYYGDVAMSPDGSFVVVWMSSDTELNDTAAFAQRFDADGVPVDDEIAVPASGTEHWEPQVAMAPDGAFVISWKDGTAVHAQFYGPNGTTIGSVIEVAADVTFAQDVAVSAGFDGTYTFAWEDATSDGDSFGIRMRRYAASGTPITDAATVNTTTAGPQTNPSVATAPNGDYAIAWTDGNRILMRVFDSLGSPLHGEINVSAKAGASSIAALPAGGYIVGFTAEDAANNGVNTLFAQRYSASGVAQDDEYRVSPPGEPVTYYYPDVAVAANGNAAFTWSNGENVRGRIMAGPGLDLVLEGDGNKSWTSSGEKLEFHLEPRNETPAINSAVAEVNSAFGFAENYSLHVHLPPGVSLDSYAVGSNWYCDVSSSEIIDCSAQGSMGRGEAGAPLSMSFTVESGGTKAFTFDLVSDDTGEITPADNSVTISIPTLGNDDTGSAGAGSGGGGGMGWLLIVLLLYLGGGRGFRVINESRLAETRNSQLPG